MARKMISIDQILANGNKSHLTKEEIEKRKEQEDILKELSKDKIRPPTWLSKQGKKIFKDIVKELINIDILANIDVYCLAILSEEMDSYIDIVQRLRADDLIIQVTNKKGFTSSQKNPLYSMKLQSGEAVRKLSSDFGLTPAARLKIIQQNAPELSEDEKQFNEDFDDV